MRRPKTHLRSRRLLVTGCGLAAITLPWAATAQAASAGSTSPAPPVYRTTAGGLAAVAAVSADDAWAVGWAASGGVLILHWNGTAWTKVAVPALPRDSELADVAASSSRNVWAVGAAGRHTLILHWNGARWRRVPSPTRSGDAGLDSVTVTRSGAAFAAGGYLSRAGGGGSMLAWSGGKWHQQRLPSPYDSAQDGASGFTGVAAASAGSAWAVGLTDTGNWTTFLRRQGTHWRVAAGPNIPGGNLTDVALAPRHRAWAVGYVDSAPLILRYTGSSWRRVATPRPTDGARLNAVAVTRDGTAWAVGQLGGSDRGFILRWTRGHWESQPAPVAGSSGTIITGVAAYSDDDAWAVGVTNGGDGFILQWTGASW